jgi:site-specific DNA-methyltransferase (adenine-specific)
MTIIQGDARELDLPGSSVDTVVTSPPYWGLRDYGTPGEIGTEGGPDEYVTAVREVLAELARVLRPDGNVFLVIGDKYARTGGVDRKLRGVGPDPGGRVHRRPVQRGVPGVPDGSLLGLPYRVALAAIEDGWLWRQDIVWQKPNPLPESVRRRCVRAHETVIHLARSAQHYTRPTTRGGELGHDVWPIAVRGYRDPAGVPTPAVYPEALVERVLTDWHPDGGVVLDPFLGSGTTAVVAARRGQPFIGVDISASTVEAARRRVEGAA